MKTCIKEMLISMNIEIAEIQNKETHQKLQEILMLANLLLESMFKGPKSVTTQ